MCDDLDLMVLALYPGEVASSGVTAEMLWAGIAAYYGGDLRFEDVSELVFDIYVAMDRARVSAES